MAVTHVRSTARTHAFRPKIRPVSGLSLRTPAARAAVAVTADRRKGVGAPTPPPEQVLHQAEEPLSTTALVKEALDTALESLDTLEHQTRDVARRFRRGARAEAQVGLTQLMQSTQTLLKLAAMAAGASGVDLEELCERAELHAEAQTQLAVGELIRQQLAEDWAALAMALDRPFAAALDGWRRVFIALGGTPTGPYGHAA
jgi:hypothetical protein